MDVDRGRLRGWPGAVIAFIAIPALLTVAVAVAQRIRDRHERSAWLERMLTVPEHAAR